MTHSDNEKQLRQISLKLLQHQHQRQQQQQQQQQQPRQRRPEDGSASKQRRREMMRRHLSARRSSGNRSVLQDNLYQLLNERQNSSSASTKAKAATQPRHNSPSVDGQKHRQQERERRRLLLEAIGMLRRLSLNGEADDKNVDQADQNTMESASNAEELPPPSRSSLSAPPPSRPSSSAPPPPSSADGGGGGESGDGCVTEQLHQLSDRLNYLALACRARQLPPPPKSATAGGAGVPDATTEFEQKIEDARKLVAAMLRRNGGGVPVCKAAQKAPAGKKLGGGGRGGGGGGDDVNPLFWHCPTHTELQTQRRRQQSQQQKVPASSNGQGGPEQDSVGRAVSRSKVALDKDPVFQVSQAGLEYKWGQMTLPTNNGRPLPNSADAIGRECLHRRRLRQRSDAARAQLLEFAGQVEDKWEAIEEARIDRAIDAACWRLRRAIRTNKRLQRRRPASGSAQTSRPRQKLSGGWAKDSEAVAAAGNDSDTNSIHWGI